ncbi:MAG: carbohydrate kinase family protein [Lentisphaeria bacterium]|nr:carbohydrate kinase family protein [Lentisphaeria bacterium]
MKKLKISVAGCSLADFLYADIDFTSPAFRACLSHRDGDGGLQIGKLIFADALEKFKATPYAELLRSLTGGKAPTKKNLGGPAIVGAINAAQILSDHPVEFDFYGATGKDECGEFIRSVIAKTPIDTRHYIYVDGPSPCSDVLSDPRAHDGKGERSFINTIGACYNYSPAELGEDFFRADVVWFGATALVPQLHNNLTALLKKAKDNGALTVVSTVFDFINEAKNPDGRWPMGDGDTAYKYIDLLLVDWDEAVRLTGETTLEGIHAFLAKSGISAYSITHGAKDFYVWSDGRIFKKTDLSVMPVSALVDADLAAHPEQRGDTTGCGDNFAGGFAASLIRQISEGIAPGSCCLQDACAWAAASGGFACFCLGGTYVEQAPGDKRAKLQRYHDAYFTQIGKK